MHSQCFARVLLPRVSLSFLSLSLFTKIFLLYTKKAKLFYTTPEETVRERDKSVSDVMRIYAAKVGEKLPRRTKPLAQARKGKRQTRRQRDERVFWKSHNAVQNNFTQ